MSARFKGLLVVNAFLNSGKFEILYERLGKNASDKDMELRLMTNADLVPEDKVAQAAREYDFCIFWDKDVRLCRRLEKANLRTFNNSRAIAVCDNKADTYEVLSGAGIPQPLTVPLPFTYDNLGYEDVAFFDDIAGVLGYPMVIKECRGSFGAQVYLAKDPAGACELLREHGSRELLAQRFIGEAAGRDLRLNMVGDECVAAMLRVNEKDFRANISNGGRGTAYEPSDAEVALARSCMHTLGLDFAGVDILESAEGPLVCEVNSNPQFVSTYECTGVDLGEAVMDYIYRELIS